MAALRQAFLSVATEDLVSDYVNVLKGNGDGTFAAAVSTVTDSAPKGVSVNLEQYSTIATGDFNGDGRLDLVVVNNKDSTNQRSGLFFQGGSASVLLGNGDGTLQAPRVFAVGTSPRSAARSYSSASVRPSESAATSYRCTCSANPVTGRRRQAVIDASYGLGESVVSGSVMTAGFPFRPGQARNRVSAGPCFSRAVAE